MKFIASINTVIYGDSYVQGQEIDLTGWTRKQILQFLGNGLISPMQITSGDLATALAVDGGLTTIINEITDQTTITLDPQAIDWLTDVDTVAVPPTDGQTLTYVASSGLWVPVTPAGGVAYTNNDRRWKKGPDETTVDEFNDDSLAAAWVRVDGTGAVLANATWTEGGDVLSVYQNGGDTASKLHALMRPIGAAMVVGDAFVMCLTAFGPLTNYVMGGLVLADGVTFGSGEQVITLDFLTSGEAGESAFVHDARISTGYTVGATQTTTQSLPNNIAFVRLVMTAANTWRSDVSPDGISWLKGANTLAKTVTPAYVGLHTTSWGTATKGVVSYEFLRRVAGIT